LAAEFFSDLSNDVRWNYCFRSDPGQHP